MAMRLSLYNLSHSKNGYAAIVVSDSAEASAVGIDIEARYGSLIGIRLHGKSAVSLRAA